MHSCRPWFFSRVFVLQRPKQLLPTHIVEHTEEGDTDPSHGYKQGWGSCKRFQHTLGTNTFQPHKRTALFGLAGLFHQEQKFRKNPSIPSPFCLGAAFSTCWLVVMFAVGNLYSVPSPNSCGLCGFARACFILKTATTRTNSDCYEKGKRFVQINHRVNKLKSTAAHEMIFLKCYDPFLQSIGNNWRRVKITKSLQNLTLLNN